MNPKVSIVVPIYNVEPHIERCLHSLFQQSFDEIEYVLVNDCSPDNSFAIANEVIKLYPKRQKYTRILHNYKNKGVSASRNFGVNNCHGKYIIQIDSDDYVEVDMIEKMYKSAEKFCAEIVVADSFEQWRNKHFYRKEIIPLSVHEYAKDMITGKCIPAIWNKLIIASLFRENNVRFPDGVNIGEDIATMPRLAYLAKKIVKIDNAFVHYVQYNKNSYSKNISTKGISDLQQDVKILLDFFEKQRDGELLNAIVIRKAITKCIVLINSSYKMQKKYYNLYPESNKCIFMTNGLPLYYKSITWLFSQEYILIANILLRTVKFAKQLKAKLLG